MNSELLIQTYFIANLEAKLYYAISIPIHKEKSHANNLGHTALVFAVVIPDYQKAADY